MTEQGAVGVLGAVTTFVLGILGFSHRAAKRRADEAVAEVEAMRVADERMARRLGELSDAVGKIERDLGTDKATRKGELNLLNERLGRIVEELTRISKGLAELQKSQMTVMLSVERIIAGGGGSAGGTPP